MALLGNLKVRVNATKSRLFEVFYRIDEMGRAWGETNVKITP